MLAEEKLRAGNVDEALSLLQDEVRKAPNKAEYRVFLFQLLAVLGRWDRALTQLKVAADLDPETLTMLQTYQELIRCEVLRGQVFAGHKAPMLFGEPEEWMAFVLEALRLDADHKQAEAEKLRTRAFEQASSVSGSVNGEPFEWIADGDVRIGPMLEVVVNGRYSWMPFSRIRSIEVEAPSDLRDLVWLPVMLTLATGAQMVAFVPTRYPGSEASTDGLIRMARRTDWTESGGGYVGLGQRVFVTDANDYPLLDARQIELNTDGPAAADAAAGQPTPDDG